MPDKIISQLASDLLSKCSASNLKIATAESCTGGLIAGALTEIAGSSDVFERGFVTYSNDAKMQMLGVSSKSLDLFGAVSEAVAKEMAYGALVNSMADLSVAVTGVAGPSGGTALKPVGTVWIATCVMGQAPEAVLHKFGDIGRENVRMETVNKALSMLLDRV
jgi:nicotinamide-nucleotide amidase